MRQCHRDWLLFGSVVWVVFGVDVKYLWFVVIGQRWVVDFFDRVMY